MVGRRALGSRSIDPGNSDGPEFGSQAAQRRHRRPLSLEPRKVLDDRRSFFFDRTGDLLLSQLSYRTTDHDFVPATLAGGPVDLFDQFRIGDL